ncbi:nuclear transport factor 2 family protein [Mycobacterium sp. NPDC003449]
MLNDQQRQQASQLLHATDHGDAAAVTSLISDDFSFYSMRRAPLSSPTGAPVPTVFDRVGFLAFVKTMPGLTKDGMHFSENLVVCEGDYVAIFGESSATAHSGEPYNNVYCWLFHFKHGKVDQWWEYCDTHLVATVLGSGTIR